MPIRGILKIIFLIDYVISGQWLYSPSYYFGNEVNSALIKTPMQAAKIKIAVL